LHLGGLGLGLGIQYSNSQLLRPTGSRSSSHLVWLSRSSITHHTVRTQNSRQADMRVRRSEITQREPPLSSEQHRSSVRATPALVYAHAPVDTRPHLDAHVHVTSHRGPCAAGHDHERGGIRPRRDAHRTSGLCRIRPPAEYCRYQLHWSLALDGSFQSVDTDMVGHFVRRPRHMREICSFMRAPSTCSMFVNLACEHFPPLVAPLCTRVFEHDRPIQFDRPRPEITLSISIKFTKETNFSKTWLPGCPHWC
jgi:hypothetical protein